VGPIFDEPNKIIHGETYTFFLFKVAIGRPYVRRAVDIDDHDSSTLSRKKKGKSAPMPPPDGYDSVYRSDLSGKNGQYKHVYEIYEPKRVQLLHKVTCEIKIEDTAN
jgi:hypothetical protein